MPEITIRNDFWERLNEFNPVESEIIKEEADLDYTVHAVLTVGLDLMMDHFFRQLDEDTLQKSIEQFYQRYPNSRKVEPSNLSDRKLVGILVTLSNTYPKQFFAFMLEKLKAHQWAEAKKAFEDLFRNVERNGQTG
jgi:hypothetical protein